MTENEKKEWFKMLLTVLQFAVALALPIIGFLFAEVTRIDHAQMVGIANADKRISVMEGNRFTSNDFGVYSTNQQKEFSKIWEALARVPKESPPSWFKERVDKLELRVDAMEEQLTSFGTKLDLILEKLNR